MNLCMDGGRTVSPKISHCELPRQRRGGGAMKGNHKAWPRGNLYLIWGGGVRPALFSFPARPSSKEAAATESVVS